MSRRTRATVLGISVWTLVQIIFHLCWISSAYFFTICRIKPTYYDVVFVYLTYFYRHNCGKIDLKNEALFLNNTNIDEGPHKNETYSDVLFYFLNATLEKGRLPTESSVATRTDVYLTLFFISDGVWAVTALFLFAGAFCNFKQKVVSLLIYGPWMLVTAYIIFLDVVSSVHFGLDMIYIHSYTTWLQFIGVSNYKDFEMFNNHSSSKVMPAIPTSIVVSLFARFFFVWLLNVVCFFAILYIFLPHITINNGTTKNRKYRKHSGSKLHCDTGEELDLNSSEARIRNWQLFYGAIEANSTMASTSTGSISSSSNDTDHNSNSKPTTGKSYKQSNLPTSINDDRKVEKLKQASISSANSGFRRFSDVAKGIETHPQVFNTNIKMQALRGQMPWSYINPDDDFANRQKPTYSKRPVFKNAMVRDNASESTKL